VLKRFSRQIDSMDWDMISFRKTGRWWSNTLRLNINDPLKFTRAELEEQMSSVTSLEDLFAAFEVEEVCPAYTDTGAYSGCTSSSCGYGYDHYSRRYQT